MSDILKTPDDSVRHILRTGTDAKDTPHVAGVYFLCHDCGRVLPVQTEAGTGYARFSEGDHLVCYDCMAIRDRADMESTGRAVLYLSEGGTKANPLAPFHVGNFPGTLEFPVYGVTKSFHNFAGVDGRRDFYFRAFGREWHGVNIGDNQIARCKVLKAK